MQMRWSDWPWEQRDPSHSPQHDADELIRLTLRAKRPQPQSPAWCRWADQTDLESKETPATVPSMMQMSWSDSPWEQRDPSHSPQHDADELIRLTLRARLMLMFPSWSSSKTSTMRCSLVSLGTFCRRRMASSISLMLTMLSLRREDHVQWWPAQQSINHTHSYAAPMTPLHLLWRLWVTEWSTVPRATTTKKEGKNKTKTSGWYSLQKVTELRFKRGFHCTIHHYRIKRGFHCTIHCYSVTRGFHCTIHCSWVKWGFHCYRVQMGFHCTIHC